MTALMALAISACTDTTMVQRRYVDVRDDCRGAAETSVGPADSAGDSPESGRNFNAKLATIFSHCMYERGWTVASPPPPGGGGNEGPDTLAKQQPAPTPPVSGSPQQQPTAYPAMPPQEPQPPVQTAPTPRTDLPQGRKTPPENPK